jgi:hypothetical protein
VKATYKDAMKYCEKDNMAVSTLDDPGEIKRVSEYLNYIGYRY